MLPAAALFGLASVGIGYSTLKAKPGACKPNSYTPPHPDTYSVYPQGQQFWATEPNGVVQPRLAKSGVASLPPITIFEVLDTAVQRFPNAVAYKYEEKPGQWVEISYTQYREQIYQVARALVASGMNMFQSVAIIGFNSPQWFLANMGAIFAGGKSAGIYTTNGPEASRYIVEHSEAAVVVTEDEKQTAKFLGFRDQCPHLKVIVQWSGKVDPAVNYGARVQVISWNDFLARGTAEFQPQVQARMNTITPGHCATLIYTSGTTGNPKAVQCSHDNVTFVMRTLQVALPELGAYPERMVSFLPLSHIAAQVVDLHGPLFITAFGKNPALVAFARPDALKGSLRDTLIAIKPTLQFGVPRVWEKMQEAMQAVAKKVSPILQKVSAFAKSLGSAKFKQIQVGGNGDVPAFFDLAKSIVFKKVRVNLGLSECRLMYTGAAPIAHATLEYFGSLDMPILELYGMSECTGPATVSKPGYFKVGSTGPALEGVEVRIHHVEGRDKAGEGEIIYRGRNVMMGYMKDPAKTAEAIDEEGFLHSGDVGRIDENGLLYITGRIKELIIGAGGENIAPVPIEDCLKKELPAISYATMIGDRRKYNVVLFTLKTDTDVSGPAPSNRLAGSAKEVAPDCSTVDQALKDAKWHAYLEAGVIRYNKQAVSNAQKIQKFAILPNDYTINGGELTATLKVKRSEVNKKYHDIIESLYAGSD